MRPLFALLLGLVAASCSETRPYANVGIGVGGGDVRVSPSLSVGGRYGGVTLYR